MPGVLATQGCGKFSNCLMKNLVIGILKKCSGRAGFMGCELGPNSNNVLYEFRFVLPNKTPFLT